MIPRSIIWRLICAAILTASSTGRTSAQESMVGKTPYQLHCVVLLGEHRFLGTEQFHEQFPRELAQRAKLALGDLVRGELTDPGISRGAAFAVCRIAVESGKQRSRRIPWAALEATGTSAGGTVACQYWRRFVDDKIAVGEGATYRALLLPTISAPLRL